MNACLASEDLKSNKYLYLFLFITDQKQFAAKMKVQYCLIRISSKYDKGI